MMLHVGGQVNKRIKIRNSLFNRLHSTAINIRSKCDSSKNIISLDNCTFDSMFTINEPVILVVLHENNNFVSFNNCTYKHNYVEGYSLVSLIMKHARDISCEFTSMSLAMEADATVLISTSLQE